MSQTNELTTGEATIEAANTAQFERSAMIHGREYANAAERRRGSIYQVLHKAYAEIADAVAGMIDDHEVFTQSMSQDLNEYKRDCSLLKIKLEASNRTVRWLRAQLTAKQNAVAQVEGGSL